MSITAIVKNDTIKLPVHVPDGTQVEITLPREVINTTKTKSVPAATSPALAWMLKFAGSIDGLPEDFADEHDHYIHGTSKRSDQ